MRHFPREDVLYLIVQYLREQNLYESAVCLLRESRIDCKWLCGPSKEIYLLREWILTGQWQKARRLLVPLENTLGSKEEYSQVMNIISKYESFELVFNEKKFKPLEQQQRRRIGTNTHLGIKKCKENIYEIRLEAYELIVPFLRGEIKEEDYEKRYLEMPTDQLVQIFDSFSQLKLDQAISKSKKKKLSNEINPQSICIDLVQKELPLTQQQSGHDLVETSPLVLGPPDVSGAGMTEMEELVDSRQFDILMRDTGRGVKNSLRQSVSGLHIAKERRVNDRLVRSMDFRSGIMMIEPESEDEDESAVVQKQKTSKVVMTCVSTQTDNVESKCEAGPICDRSQNIPTPIENSYQEPTKSKEKKTGVDISTSTVMEIFFTRPEKALEEPEVDTTVVVDSSKSSCSTPSSTTEQVLEEEEEEDMPPPPAYTDQINVARNKEISNFSASVERAAVIPPSNFGNGSRKPIPLNNSTNVSTSILHHQIQQLNAPIQITNYSQLNEETIAKLHVVAETKEAQAIRAMDVSKSGKLVAIGTNARVLRLLDISSSLQQEPVISSINFSRNSISKNPIGSSMSGGSGTIASLLPVVAEKYKHHTSSIYCVGWNSTDTLLATGSAESCIKILPVNTSSFNSEDLLDDSRQLLLTQHEGKTREVQFTPELHRNLLMTAASGDQVLRFWDIDSGKIDTSCIELDGHAGEILCARFRGHSRVGVNNTPANSHQVLSCALDQTIRLWDLRSGCCEKMWTKMPSDAFSLGISPVNGKFFVIPFLWDIVLNVYMERFLFGFWT
jgi:WD40 repeat protein